MPTYDYRCRECSHEFEEYQPITADALVICPKCGKHSLKRVFGAGGGLIFKGTGFYLTDYKKNGTSPASTIEKKKIEAAPSEKKEGNSKPAEDKSTSTETPAKPAEPKKE
jgi:putative FmdB family regulatory protein